MRHSEKDDGLQHLVEEGVIDAVHARLMSGKEATVFVVERAGFMGAAKVYRARDDRTFKKVASYVEGRNQTRNSRDRRAMDKKTTYGRGLLEEGWQDMEFRALRLAWDAGVRVPEPFFLYENVLFMELVVDANGAPAERLADRSYTSDEATAVHLEVFLQVKRLLETGQVHGDLSAYNVLMAAAGPTIIDLPQVVDISRNTNARQILRRDLRNVTEHLARFDARLLRFADCGDALFRRFLGGTLDMVTGPEESAPVARGGAGRRGRDAERGRAGRDKGGGRDNRPGTAPRPQQAGPPQTRPPQAQARPPQSGSRPPQGSRPPPGPLSGRPSGRPQGPSRGRR
jgi:RIO kinase 1